MTNKEIFYFVGKCLALDANPGFRTDIINYSQTDCVDWKQFVTISSNHLILPAIYLKFRDHNILEYIPDDLSQYLTEVYELNVVRNNQILNQLQKITKVLNRNSIYPIFLKGVAFLLDGFYSDIGERIMADIDFLVSEEDYLASAEIMKDEGYAEIYAISGDVKRLRHYPRLFHLDCVANIEIHRLPVDEDYQSWFNTKIIDAEKRECSSLMGCYVPSDQHKIIHNFIHGQLASEGNLLGLVSFREIYDLFLLSKRVPLTEVADHIKTSSKAIAYFAIARVMLGLNKSFFPRRNLAFWILLIKHSLNLRTGFLSYVFRSIIIALQLILRYLLHFIKAFYSRKERQYLYGKITNSNHLKLYARFFKRNN